MVTKLRSRAIALIIGAALALSFPAFADRFIYFGSVTGVLKGDAHSYQTTAATGADIAGTFTGSCDSSTFLGGDGVCRAAGSPTGTALTRTNDTNVTLTLGGTPASALLASTSITAGWTGQLAAARGGTGVASLGDLTRTNDTNVTLTLGGTPTGALINSTSMTLGWTGQLAASRGGTGVSSLGDITKVNDTNVTLTLGGTPAGSVVNSTSFTLGWTGTLAAARGGTDGASPTDDNVMVGSGSAWASKALTSCSAATSAVTYNTTTNAFGCNTISGGVAQTTGTFTITWDNACTTSPTSAVAYSQTGDIVTWRIGPMSGTNCTSDSTAFATTTAIVPSGIRPTVDVQIPVGQVKNNGNDVNGCINILANGTVNFDFQGTAAGQVACNGAAWTNTGSKNVMGYTSTSVTYKQ